jgi:hypothetical protein
LKRSVTTVAGPCGILVAHSADGLHSVLALPYSERWPGFPDHDLEKPTPQSKCGASFRREMALNSPN